MLPQPCLVLLCLGTNCLQSIGLSNNRHDADDNQSPKTSIRLTWDRGSVSSLNCERIESDVVGLNFGHGNYVAGGDRLQVTQVTNHPPTHDQANHQAASPRFALAVRGCCQNSACEARAHCWQIMTTFYSFTRISDTCENRKQIAARRTADTASP